MLQPKRATALLAALLLTVALALPLLAARVNTRITITSGTPTQISTVPLMATRLFIQARHGGTGIVYVMDGIPKGVTASKSNVAHVTAELAPPTATAPGGSYSDTDPAGIDLSKVWIDGDVTSDTVIVSYDVKN